MCGSCRYVQGLFARRLCLSMEQPPCAAAIRLAWSDDTPVDGGTLMLETKKYWDMMESSDPEVWPGSTPWRDQWGSFGSIPDAKGYGASVDRTRVPVKDLPRFWSEITERYPSQLPRFTVGPRETLGLGRWLQSHGYHREISETVLVLNREAFDKRGPVLDVVNEVVRMEDLKEVFALDHLVFRDPIPDPKGLAQELARLGPYRRLFYIRSNEGMAKATGGVTHFPGWSLVWGGQTHPEFRQQGLYHAVLARRIAAVQETTALFCAVYANNETSAPILIKAGFEPIGTMTVYKPFGARSGVPI